MTDDDKILDELVQDMGKQFADLIDRKIVDDLKEEHRKRKERAYEEAMKPFINENAK